MKKRRVLLLTVELIFLISVFSFSIIYMNQSFSITGFTIYTEQPNSTNGTDSYLRQNSGTNYGTGTIMKIGKTVGGEEFRPLLKFNTSSIPQANTVISANIQFYVSTIAGNNLTIKAYQLTTDWNESTTNWTSANGTNSCCESYCYVIVL